MSLVVQDDIGVVQDDIVSAGYVTARYMQQHYSQVKHVYLIGSRGLEEELQLVGISHCGHVGVSGSQCLHVGVIGSL